MKERMKDRKSAMLPGSMKLTLPKDKAVKKM